MRRAWRGTGSGRSASCASTRHRPGASCAMGRRRRWATRFAQPELARTLRGHRRARRQKAFYEGEVAADIVATLRAAGGLHTEEDFARGADVAPNSSTRSRSTGAACEVFQCPPNGVGHASCCMILGILGELRHARAGAARRAERYHRHIEAARLAYRDRDAFVADPSQVDVPVEQLLSARLPAAACAASSATTRAMARTAAGRRERCCREAQGHGLSLRGRSDGNACSFINSLFEGFGTGILAEKSGVMLQNRGFGFRVAARPSELHRAEQAADAHHHPRHGDEGRSGGHALRRDGRALPADGADAVPHQPLRIRPRHAGGARPAAPVPAGRQGAGRTRHPRPAWSTG